ncbi:MAG: transpeptidase family protein [Bacteroidota bacterium]|nr:transpeptidase family protein [Bacteroidota bacterium]
MEIKRDILWRVYLSFLGIVVLSFLVLGRAFYIQEFEGKYWRSMSDSLHQRIMPLDAERGMIYSEDGQMLSTSLPTFDIYIDFAADGLREKNGKRFKENVDSFSIAMANFFGDKTKAEYKRDLQIAFKNKERYYLLKKKLSFEQFKVFREFPLARLGRNRSGVIPEVKSIRLNPYGLLANRTIGLSRDNAQNIGLERTYDPLLKGATGQRLVRFIAGGAAVPVEGYEIEPENGKDIISTIDVNIQDITENALMKMLLQSESEYGTCIVMETKTGKIKALANLGRRPDGSYWEDYNYALRTTEPGSTIKLATLLSVLEEGHTTMNDLVQVGSTGSAYVGVRNVNDAERAPKPVLTVKECFAHSSNVGMSTIAYKTFATQPDKFLKYLHHFRLDTLSGIDLMGEEKPVLPKMKRNNEGLHAMVTMSFGYAIEISPLQTLMLYNAIANEGKMMKPYLVSRIENSGILLKEFSPVVLENNICKPQIVKAAKECMRAVVTEGTAKNVFKETQFQVAGKTGTAHVAGGKVKYGDGVYQATFVGYFPSDEPKYSCIVVIKTKPHAPLHYGGQLAAPVFKEIATKLYAMYVENKNATYTNIVNDSAAYYYAGYTTDIKNIFNTLNIIYSDSVQQNYWSSVYNNNYRPVIKGNPVRSQVMPDVKGMGLKDALYLLENIGIKVITNGRGRIVAQSIQAGTALSKGLTVYIQLG